MSPRLPTEPRGPSPSRDAYRRTWVVGWLIVGSAATGALAVSWVRGGSVELLGLLGAVTVVAYGIIFHHVVVTQDAGEQQVARPDTSRADLPVVLGRRRLLVGSLVVVVAGLAALVGLQRFVPRPPSGSEWRAGAALVTVDGERLRPSDIPLGGVVTVWPEGFAGTERSAVMLLRLRDAPQLPTRLDGVVDGTLVAYSRLCTHAGCAVALYRDHDQALFCPCHQATFDARRGATPQAGPASAPLPQLPLGLDGDGHLIATGDLTARPGPVGARTDASGRLGADRGSDRRAGGAA